MAKRAAECRVDQADEPVDLAREAWADVVDRGQQQLARGGRRGARQKAAIPVMARPRIKRMDVVRALIGVDRLQIGGVAHDLEFGRDAVAAVHVARDPGDLERLAAHCCA